jgi:hypothetical protein
MNVEDQLRAAGRAVRDQVRDLPELDLTTSAPARPGTRPGAPRRWRAGWLIPLAAAAAVVAIAATLVAVKSPPRAAHQTTTGPATSRSAGSASPSAADPEALPGYFVAISGLAIMGQKATASAQTGLVKDPQSDSVVVGETLTGRRLATVTPPPGSTFVGVTGAADDRTFVLDSVKIVPGLLSPTEQRTWYLLRITPGATPATTLTKLNLPVPAAADVNGIALSPAGTSLAVFYQLPKTGDGDFPYSGPFTLAVYSVATGAPLRTWTGTNPFHGSLAYGDNNGLPDSNSQLSWSSDGQRLAFDYRSSTDPDSASLYLREVNLSRPGKDLLADSTVIAEIAVSPTTGRSKIWCDSLGITGDGQSAVCGAELPKAAPVGATLDALTEPAPWTGCAAPTDTAYPGLAEISLTGDRLTRVLYEAEPACMGAGTAPILWSSPSGDTVLGAVSYTDGPSMTEHSAIILYRHGTATMINWPGAVSTLQVNQTAF